ncbi:hypothetical protein [Shinella pollutisoli]|uniref:Bacteriophage holin of superfamily 6 (Holin_LLH) n=1 Tax=Shinella pollutisoli TaxID=2250594 RepID=A0ABV7DJK2_9HYPH|nr:hypothetical protein [Shinella pollutisoli]
MRDLFLIHVLPLLIDLLLPVLIGFVLVTFRRYAGVQIEGKHMATLQSALGNAAKLMLAGGSIDEAVIYVRKAAPDALDAFGISTRQRIEELLRPHMAALKVL